MVFLLIGWTREARTGVISGDKHGTVLWPNTALVGGTFKSNFVNKILFLTPAQADYLLGF